jgi:flagellar motor switch protein FliG
MIATTNSMHESGIRKAAILVASLDQAATDLLLDQLGPACAELVREAVMALDEIDPEEQRRIVEEFRRIGPMVPDQSPAGIELDQLTVGQTFSCAQERAEMAVTPDTDDALQSHNTADTEQQSSQPFGFLHGAEEGKLLQLLGSERPQTIALVLSHLPPQRAGEVLALFAPPLQVEVVRRLVDLEDTDPETLRHVEEALEARLSRQFAMERARSAGPDAVARILASCNSRVVVGILDNLATYDRPLAERFGRRSLRFDDLVQLDDATLLATFRTAEAEVAQAALLGAPPQLVERVLRRMRPEESKNLQRKLDYPGPIRLSDIEDARQQIALLAERALRGAPRKVALAA